MDRKSFASSGNWPTLLSAFLYFDVSFMVWVLFGPLAPFIAEQIHLTATEKGLLTAIPLLGGSFFRPVLGLLADRIGGRKSGTHWTPPHHCASHPWLALRHSALAVLRYRLPPRHCRSQLRRRPPASRSLVSRRTPGPRYGHRRSRKLRHTARHLLRPASRATLRLALRLRPRACSRASRPRYVLPSRERQPRQIRAQVLEQIRAALHTSRHLAALLPLQPHLRRLRRSHQLPHYLLPRSVPPQQSPIR